jgi:hypothetical protein
MPCHADEIFLVRHRAVAEKATAKKLKELENKSTYPYEYGSK